MRRSAPFVDLYPPHVCTTCPPRSPPPLGPVPLISYIVPRVTDLSPTCPRVTDLSPTCPRVTDLSPARRASASSCRGDIASDGTIGAVTRRRGAEAEIIAEIQPRYSRDHIRDHGRRGFKRARHCSANVLPTTCHSVMRCSRGTGWTRRRRRR